MHQKVRRPLIIMSPKSLLRHKKAISSLEDLAGGQFEEILTTPLSSKKSQIKRILLASGKVYYDLLEYAQKNKIDSLLLVRLEQLYPFPKESLEEVIAAYKHVQDVRWVQEEPKNQGSWHSQRHNMKKALLPSMKLYYVGRPDSAAPAVGYFQLHKKEQEDFLKEAFECLKSAAFLKFR
jgi:2-oxoglutarate dehydrogenase E1 component